MHRCWLDAAAPPATGDTVALSRPESEHMVKVLRMKAGDVVRLISADRLYGAEIGAVKDGVVHLRITEELPSPEPAVKVTLVQGLPKADKLEWIVQKATELGVHRVLPVETARSVARITAKEDMKRERLGRIALEAAKQAGRAHVPEILPVMRFSDALKELHGTVYAAWEEETSLRLSEAVIRDRPGEITLVIGPEGGITEEEIGMLTALGAKTVTLGRRILRTETAGICALAVAMAALGEM
ncbi:MAG: 16S rRNA (uracil(1498)-N(3))-methyltransferase [Clostridiales bacterium]|nr:16S rRNA (uracil(1498)-N(3))-methyltransferase [Clostridiales bacterium]